MDNIIHVIPLDIALPDIVHEGSPQLVRSYHDDDCVCCQAGRCWQRVDMNDLDGIVVVHGLAAEN